MTHTHRLPSMMEALGFVMELTDDDEPRAEQVRKALQYVEPWDCCLQGRGTFVLALLSLCDHASRYSTGSPLVIAAARGDVLDEDGDPLPQNVDDAPPTLALFVRVSDHVGAHEYGPATRVLQDGVLAAPGDDRRELLDTLTCMAGATLRSVMNVTMNHEDDDAT